MAHGQLYHQRALKMHLGYPLCNENSDDNLKTYFTKRIQNESHDIYVSADPFIT